MISKIGLLVGREWSFPPAFIAAVHERGNGVVAEYVKLGTPDSTEVPAFQVIIDRISHEVDFYRSYLRHAVAHGVSVINNPYAQDVQDRFYAASVANRVGVRMPATVMLPHRDYGPEIVHEESLRNLDYPLDWDAVMRRVGTPCLLRDARIGGPSQPVTCHSVEELLRNYNDSGRKLMIAQERIEWDYCVRCIAIGEHEVVMFRYDPQERKHLVGSDPPSSTMHDELASSSLRLSRAFGYDLNAVDWAIRGDEAIALEVVDPVPDLDIYELSEPIFEDVVARIADLAIRLASRAGHETAGEAGDLAEELPSLARDLPESDL